MRKLDDELKNVLRRVEPPAGFADRVLRRTGIQPPARPLELVTATRTAARRPPSIWYRFAAAAALVVALGGAMEYRELQKERAERLAGEAAKEKVVLALHIASSKLQIVQTKINRLNEQPDKKVTQ
jgi:hypothetical protein